MPSSNTDIIAKVEEEEANQVRVNEALFEQMSSETSKYTIEERVMAVTYYAITGSSLQASKHMAAANTTCPASTIREWKNNSTWWKPLLTEVRKAKQDELDGKLTDIIMAGTEALRDRLENGNVKYDSRTGEQYRIPLTSGELAKDTIGIMFDKRALLRGDPTQRIERTSTDEHLKMLAAAFIKMTAPTMKPAIDVTHEVVPNAT